MKSLFPLEYLSCAKFKNKNKDPEVEIRNIVSLESLETQCETDKIIFIINGELNTSCKSENNVSLSEGKMVLFPEGYYLKCLATVDTTILIFRLRTHFPLCECLMSHKLLEKKQIKDEQIEKKTSLKIKPGMWMYIRNLIECVNAGFNCTFFYEAKLKELYYFIDKYYSQQEIFDFFSPLLNYDIRFQDYVIRNHHKARTAKELASMMNYSLSGFEKHFKKVFNQSPGQWMKTIRSENIYNEIKFTSKTLKKISDDYGFYSPSHFNDYCKKRFEATPGEIRNELFISNEE